MTGNRATIAIGERLDDACVRTVIHGVSSALSAGARVLVIEGGAGRFCLGIDYASLETHHAAPSLGAARPGGAGPCDPVAQRDRLAAFAGMMQVLLLAPIPTIAVVDGPALGGGLGVAAACDYVLASERARFGLPESLYGLAPAIIRPALAARISAQRVRMMVVTCHSRSAREAAKLGLVDEVVAVDLLDAACDRAARELARANGDTVAALRRWDADALARALAAGVEETHAALARPAVRAAIAAGDPMWLDEPTWV